MGSAAIQQVWPHWTWFALVTAVLLTAGYLAVVGPLRRRFPRSAPVSLGVRGAFVTGMAVYALAFGSPIDYVGDTYLFSVHMIQHMLEVSVMTPLLIVGIPDWLMQWALSWRPWERLMTAGTHPVAALVGFDAVFDGFHFPLLYDLTLTNDAFHVFEHVLFFIGAWFVWWRILSRIPEIPRLTPGWRLLYVFFAFDGMMPPAIVIFMWNRPLYGPYVHAARIFGIGPVADQRLGALIMLMFMVVSYGAAAIKAFLEYDMAGWYE